MGKTAGIGRIEMRDCSINSRSSGVLCLSFGRTSSKPFEQHDSPLSDGVPVSLIASALVLWQQVDRASVSPPRIF